jgi:WD40 repeat protein
MEFRNNNQRGAASTPVRAVVGPVGHSGAASLASLTPMDQSFDNSLDQWVADGSACNNSNNGRRNLCEDDNSINGVNELVDENDISVDMMNISASEDGNFGGDEDKDGTRLLDFIVKPWKMPYNMVDCLYLREYSGLSRQRQLTQLTDAQFVKCHEWELKDYLNAPTTISTISIAISKDGGFIATSHGDHTVKVFNFRTAEIRRVLRGHPRTPWTVKFHPLNSNVLASGCLGGEVRVWDVTLGVCTNYVTMDNSIISIAFHPQGDCLAISSGYLLSMWDYRHMMAPAHGGYQAGEDPLNEWKSIRHPRNIRAVMFHPSGEYIFVAAPDHPKSTLNSTANILRLYAIPCVILSLEGYDGDEGLADDTLDLWTMPTVIPEVR